MTTLNWNVDDISLRKQLLKLNRQKLIKLCKSKKISHKGTKQDMVKCLIKYRSNTHTQSQQNVSSNSTKQKHQNDIKTNDNNKSKKSYQHKSKKGSRMVSNNRKVGRWVLGETLGKGGYSWVKKGYDRKDGHVVALKFTSKEKGDWSASQSKQIQNEIEALRQIKHKNVLQLLAYDINSKYPRKDGLIIPSVLLVLEYLPGGELFDILYYTSALTETIARTYFKQLIQGMEAIHKVGICHRDIKPQNLLLDANFQLKIADCGLAKIFEKDDDELIQTFYVGTRGYQSPEILKKGEYTTACDVFSCGVVLFILLAGYPPCEAATSKCRWYAPLAQIKPNAREFWKQHRGCGIPGPAKDLITRMIWCNFKKRISIRGIKKHKWYNNGESLNVNELTSELRKLHHLLEIKRREDAEKQKHLTNDYYGRDWRCVKIWNHYRIPSPQEREIQEACQQADRREEYWNDDIVENIGDISTADLRYVSGYEILDVMCIFDSEYIYDFYEQGTDLLWSNNILHNNNLIEWMVYKLRGWRYSYDEYILIVFGFCRIYYLNKYFNSITYQFPNGIILLIINIVKSIETLKSPHFDAFAQKGDFKDMYLELYFSIPNLKCIAPKLPPNESVTLKDIYTTFKPRNACMEAHLATHNFPAPVIIQIRIFEATEKRCFLVKFERIGGDTLHFGRVLKQLIRKCGHCLTGVPKNQFKCSPQDRIEAERLFGDNQLIT